MQAFIKFNNGVMKMPIALESYSLIVHADSVFGDPDSLGLATSPAVRKLDWSPAIV